MGLLILVAGVVAGITVIVLAVHLTGGSRTAKLVDRDDARRRLALDFPEESVGEIWLTRDEETAFLSLGEGRLGVVHSVGSHFLTRIVCAADVAHLACSSDNLSIRLKDFSWRGGRFEFEKTGEAQAIADELNAARTADRWEAA